jgi:hypothetical protein
MTRMQKDQSKDERKLALIEIQKIREKTFKLLVKILSWESGAMGSIVVSTADRITTKEWTEYKGHRTKVLAAYDNDKVKLDFEKTFNSIKANGGFE